MATDREILKKWLDKTQKSMIVNYHALGLKASGEWEKSLFNAVTQQRMEIIGFISGKPYTEFMVNGRPRNKKQDKKSLKAFVGYAGSTFLKDWVKDKGLEGIINPFAVAWNIAKRGITVPNEHNKGTLISSVVNDQSLNDLKQQLTLHYISEFKSKILLGE